MCGRLWSPLCWDVSSVVLVWSFFFFLSFSFELARRCYCCLFRWSACLLISSFFLRLLFCKRRVSPQVLQTLKTKKKTKQLNSPPLTPSLSLYLSLSSIHTHSHTHTLTPTYTSAPKYPHHNPLCLVVSVWLQLLTDSLVFLQSRKASEQAKSVDSKTDSIGSGRAIPIKQVSTFTHLFPLHFP